MMKRWIWLSVAIALVMTSCLTSTPNTLERPVFPPPTVATAPAVESFSDLIQPTTVPQMNGDRILQTIQALDFVRYDRADRDRARQYLLETLKADGWSPTTQSFQGGVNIIAKPAKPDPKAKRILLVAHYDTVQTSPGADDNASGVAVALEVARQLRSRSTPYQLEVTLFDLEERGLVGSFAFAANPANLTNLVGVLNLEMVGFTCHTLDCQRYPEGLPVTPPSDRGDFLAVVGDREHSYLLDAFQLADDPTLPPLITLPIPYKGILTPDILRSDHAAFWAKNIGAVMVTDTADFRNPHYHRSSDTFETLDPAFLTGVAQRVAIATTALLEQGQ